MEKAGLYNRGSILLSKSKKSVNKNYSLAVKFPFEIFNRTKNIRKPRKP